MKKVLFFIMIFSMFLFGCNSNIESDNLDSDQIEFKISELELNKENVFDYNGQDAIIVKRDDGVRVFYKKCPIHPTIPTFTTNEGHSCPHGDFDKDGVGKTGLPARVDYPMYEIPFIQKDDKIIINN